MQLPSIHVGNRGNRCSTMLYDSKSDRDTSNNRLRIAQVAPLYESVPPQLYGGTERVVSWLTEELVGLGHDVTLFASGDSRTTGHLVPVCPTALWRDPDARETLPHHVRMLELVFRDLSRFDVIHFHCDYIHFRRPSGSTSMASEVEFRSFD